MKEDKTKMPADSDLIVPTGEDRNIDKNNFKSLAERSKHEDFIRRAADLLIERVVFGRSMRSAKVVEWASPEDIKTAIDLKPRDSPMTHDELLKLMADVSLLSKFVYFIIIKILRLRSSRISKQ